MTDEHDTFPSGTIAVTIPFPEGISFDRIPRAFCGRFEKSLGVPLTFANVTGGEGVAGAAHVAATEPDGYSLLVGSKGALTSHPHVEKSGYQPGDFAAIGQFAEAPIALAVAASSPYQTLADFLEAARQRPGALSYSTPNPRHTQHLAITEFAKREGMAFAFVEIAGGNPAAIEKVISGDIDFAFLGAHNYVDPVASGAVRVLGVAARDRVPFLPDQPTCLEQGVDLVTAIWLGLLTRQGAPESTLAVLRRAFDAAAGDSALRPEIESHRAVAAFLDHAAFQRRIDDDFERHGTVLRDMGLIGG